MTRARLWVHDGDMAQAEDLISTAEVARLLGRSHRTVHRLVLAGRLKPAIVAPGGNGVYMFARADVDAYMASAS